MLMVFGLWNVILHDPGESGKRYWLRCRLPAIMLKTNGTICSYCHTNNFNWVGGWSARKLSERCPSGSPSPYHSSLSSMPGTNGLAELFGLASTVPNMWQTTIQTNLDRRERLLTCSSRPMVYTTGEAWLRHWTGLAGVFWHHHHY
jgi:hypothetical protein